jgi:hypothetical protein
MSKTPSCTAEDWKEIIEYVWSQSPEVADAMSKGIFISGGRGPQGQLMCEIHWKRGTVALGHAWADVPPQVSAYLHDAVVQLYGEGVVLHLRVVNGNDDGCCAPGGVG